MADLVQDRLLANNAFGFYQDAPSLNPKYGDSMGYNPDWVNFDSHTPHLRRNLICLLLAAPVGFKKIDNTGTMNRILKSLVELQAKTIDGVQGTVEWEYQSTAFGGAGEEHFRVSDAKITQSTPTFTFVEREGKPIKRFFDAWGRGLLMDPYNKVPYVVGMNTDVNWQNQLLVPSFQGATMLFIEPDATHQFVLDAFLSTNMQPETSGENVQRREITSGGEILEYSIGFKATTQTGPGVRAVANRLFSTLNIRGAQSVLVPAFMRNLDATTVPSGTGVAGYGQSLVDAARNNIHNAP